METENNRMQDAAVSVLETAKTYPLEEGCLFIESGIQKIRDNDDLLYLPSGPSGLVLLDPLIDAIKVDSINIKKKAVVALMVKKGTYAPLHITFIM